MFSLVPLGFFLVLFRILGIFLPPRAGLFVTAIALPLFGSFTLLL